MEESSIQQQIELLERAVNEIDALEAIYGCDDDNDDNEANGNADTTTAEASSTKFAVISLHELEIARQIMESSLEDGSSDATFTIPQLEIEIKLVAQAATKIMSLRFRLPPGYPDVPALVSVSMEGLTNKQKHQLSHQLCEEAESLVGCESVMSLVDKLQDVAAAMAVEESSARKTEDHEDGTTERMMFSRRWIWVHHIKNTDRRKSIVKEARGLKLGGYLKSGYPGVIVVEGFEAACNEFVTWVKGNKSRPGGFGRNWGHHVRGEINIPLLNGDDKDDNFDHHRRLPLQFEELEELSELGSLCKDHGLEDEFLQYVMQHKSGSN